MDISHQRKEILRYLEKKSPPLCESYKAVIRLLEDDAFPARIHLIGHLVRDLINRIIEIFLEIKSGRSDYHTKLKEISPLWQKNNTVINWGENPYRSNAGISLDSILYRNLNDLFSEVDKQQTQKDKIQLFLSNKSTYFSSETEVKQFQSTYDYFMSLTHLRKEEVEYIEDELISNFRDFELSVSSVIGNIFTNIKLIDDIFARDVIDVKIVIPLLCSPQHSRYFFEHCNNKEVIQPLYDNGVFRSAPDSISINGELHWPLWPASIFLVRMASESNVLALKILSEIETDNPNVNHDIIMSGSSIPLGWEEKIGTKVLSMLKTGNKIFYFHMHDLVDVVGLILEKKPESDIGYLLAKSIFDKCYNSKSINEWIYIFFEALEKLIPPLLAFHSKAIIEYLCELLQIGIKQKYKHFNMEILEDNSYIWRPAIEDHEQNHEHEIVAKLVKPLRDACVLALDKKYISLIDLLNILHDQRSLIFYRIKLYIINVFAEKEKETAISHILDRTNFDNNKITHEYSQLVKKRFGLLNDQQKELFLSWIITGPDKDEYIESIGEYEKRIPSDDEISNYVSYWKYEKLWWIKEYLTGELSAFISEMLAKHGVPELSEFESYIKSSWGLESPVAVEELLKLEPAEAIAKIERYRDKNGNVDSITKEALMAALAKYTEIKFNELNRDISGIMKSTSDSLHAIIAGTMKKLAAGDKIIVDNILDICISLISNEEYGRSSRIHSTIYLLIEECLKEKNNIDIALKDKIWSIIKTLTTDPDKSYIIKHGESKDKKVNPLTEDYLEYSLNNPRGEAYHLIFDYARWVLRSNSQGGEGLAKGWDKIPEVKNFLEHDIRNSNFNAFSVRSVYGENIGLLNWIDKEWLRSHIDLIFDLQSIESNPDNAYGWAAWNTFLMWVRPHREYYDLLEGQFSYALQKYTSLKVEDPYSKNAACSFAIHISVLFGRGNLDIDINNKQGLIYDFFTKCDKKLRAYAIDQIGSSLFIPKGEEIIPAKITSRFMTLWHWYWKDIALKEEPVPNNLFGSWYICSSFNRQWSLEQFAEYMEHIDYPKWDKEIYEYLAGDSKLYPAKAIKVLVKLIRNVDYWRVSIMESFISQILSNAIEANQETKAIAIELIDNLGRKGFLKFGELLGADED